MFKGLMGTRSSDRLDETSSKSSSHRRERKDRDRGDRDEDDDRSVAASSSHSGRRRKRRTDSSQVSTTSSSSKRKSSRGDDREKGSSHRSTGSSSRRHRDDNHEDDTRSEITSRSRGDPDTRESREERRERRRRRERRKAEEDGVVVEEDEEDEDPYRDERHRTRSADDDDDLESSRAANSAEFAADINKPGFSQFPSQYDGGMPGPPPGRPAQSSPGFDSRVTQQFPGQFQAPATGFGLAAEYYGDQGQSVAHQPGVRPQDSPVPPNTQPHLMPATTTAAPPAEPSAAGQTGAAANFFGPPPGNVEGYPAPTNNGSRPPKPPKPGKTSTSSTSEAGASTFGIGPTGAALGAAAAGATAGYAMSHHSSTHENRPDNNQAPAQYGIGVYPPPNNNGHPPPRIDNNQHSTSNAAYVAAGAMGAAGLAAAAGHGSHSGSNYPSGSVHQQGSLAFHQRHHRGPLTRFVDFWRDPYGVAQFEEYSEAIGVCKYCFEPGTTSRDAPRKHRYRRRSSNERLHSSARIDKQSRYGSDDEGRRKKKSSKKPWIAAGLAALVAKSVFSSKDFDDTYSVRSGKRAGSEYSLPNESASSLGRGSRKTHRTRHSRSRSNSRSRSRDRIETGITGDGKVYKKDPHGGFFGGPNMTTYETRRRDSRSRSSSSSSSGSKNKHHSKMKKAAIGAAVGGAAYAVSKSRKKKSRSRSPKKRRSRRYSSSSSSSGSSSSFVDMSRGGQRSGGGGIGSFFTAPSARKTRAHQQKKSRPFFSFGNDSSSSSEADLAFGTGYVRPKPGQQRNRTKKKESNHDVDAALLGLGATATALAASASHSDRSRKNGHDVVAVKERRNNRSHSDPRHKPAIVSQTEDDDDGWESASDDESSTVSLNLAYGDSPSRSKESLTSDSGTSKWGWRWGRKKPDKRQSGRDEYGGSDGRSYIGPVAAGAAGALAGGAIAAHSRDQATDSRTSLQSMQNVFPVPTSDPSNFDAMRQTSLTSGPYEQTPVVTTGPGSIPLQQPQPIAPVSQAVYTQGGLAHSYSAPSGPPVFSNPPEPMRFDSQGPLYDSPTTMFTDPGQRPERFETDDRVNRRRDTSPAFASPRDPAARSAIRSSSVREPMSVQFDLTEEQAAKERRLKERQQEEESRYSSSYDQDREERRRRRREREEELRKTREEQAEIERERRARERERAREMSAQSISRTEEERHSKEPRPIASDLGYEYISDDKRSDDGHEKSSSSWVAPVAAGALGGVAAAAIASKSGHSDEETKSQPRRESRREERREERRRAREQYEQAMDMEKPDTSQPAKVLDYNDPETMENQRRFAKSAASHVKSTPSPGHESYASYFSPPGLREHSRERSSGAPSPSVSERERFGIEYGEGDLPSASQDRRLPGDVPWTVPRLNLIEPTPPPSTVGSVRGRASPVGLPDSVSEEDECAAEEETERSPTGSKVTWGKEETREYDVSSPVREREGVDSEPVERAFPAPEPEETVVSPSTRDSQAHTVQGPAADEAQSSGEPEVIERSAPSQMPGSFGDDIEFAATLAAGAAVAGFDPSVVTDDPSYHRRDSPPGSEEGVHISQFADVTQDEEVSPDLESTRQVRGFVEGEVPETPDWESKDVTQEHGPVVVEESSRDLHATQDEEEVVPAPSKKMSKKEKRKNKKKKGSKQETEDLEEETPASQEEAPEYMIKERQLVEEPEPVPGEQQDDVMSSLERTDDNDFFDAEEGQAAWQEEGKVTNGEEVAQVEDIPDDVTERAPGSPAEDIRSQTSDVEDSRRSKSRSKRHSEGDYYDESRSAVSAPVGDGFDTPKKSKRRSKRHEEFFDQSPEALDTARSVDDSGHRKKSKKKSKRDSSTGFDDSASIASTPARIDDTKEKRKGSKDKKSGGLFGSVFGGSKSEEPQEYEKHASRSEIGTEDLVDPEESKRKGKKKSSKSRHSSSRDDYDNYEGSVTELSQSGRMEDLDGDAESHRSSSKRKDRKEKRRSRYEDIVESGRTSQDDRQRAAVDQDDENEDERHSFLAARPELPTESDDAGASGLRSPFEEGPADDSGTALFDPSSRSTEPHTRSHSTPPRAGEKFADSPHQSPSRPSSPSQDNAASRRLSMLRSVEAGPSSPGQSSSPTAVPLHFRRPGQGRSTSVSSPGGAPLSGSPVSRHKRFQSTEFRVEREIRPLWLVERHSPAKHDPEPEDTFPSLPSSKTPSRSTSVEDLKDTGFDGDYFATPLQSPYEPRRRPTGLQIYTGHDQDQGDDDLLDSQQATPTAATFKSMGLGPAPEGSKKEKPKYEFHSPSELLQDIERDMAGSPDFEKLPSAEASLVGGKDEKDGDVEMERELENLPQLPESRPSSSGYETPSEGVEKSMDEVDKSSGLLPAAGITALTGAAAAAATVMGSKSEVDETPGTLKELEQPEVPEGLSKELPLEDVPVEETADVTTADTEGPATETEPQTTTDDFQQIDTSSKKSKKDKKKAKKKGRAADIPDTTEEPSKEASFPLPEATELTGERSLPEETTRELPAEITAEAGRDLPAEETARSVPTEPQDAEDLFPSAPVSSKKSKRDKKKKKGKTAASEEEPVDVAEPSTSEPRTEDQTEAHEDVQPEIIATDAPPEEAEQSRDLAEPQDAEDLFPSIPVSSKKSKKDKKKKKGKTSAIEEPMDVVEPAPEEPKGSARSLDEPQVQATPEVVDESEQTRDLPSIPEGESREALPAEEPVPLVEPQDIPAEEYPLPETSAEEPLPEVQDRGISLHEPVPTPEDDSGPIPQPEAEKEKDITAPIETAAAEDEWAGPTSGKKKKGKKKNKKGKEAEAVAETDVPQPAVVEEQIPEDVEKPGDFQDSRDVATERGIPSVPEETAAEPEVVSAGEPVPEPVEEAEAPPFEDALETSQHVQDTTTAVEPAAAEDEWTEPSSSKKKGKKGKKGKGKIADLIPAIDQPEESQEGQDLTVDAPEAVEVSREMPVEDVQSQELPSEEPASTAAPVLEPRGEEAHEPSQVDQDIAVPIETATAEDEWAEPSGGKKKKGKKGKKGKATALPDTQQTELPNEPEEPQAQVPEIPEATEKSLDLVEDQPPSEEMPTEESLPTSLPGDAPEQDTAAVEPTTAEDEWSLPTSGKKKKGKKNKKSRAASLSETLPETQQPDPSQERSIVEEDPDKGQETRDVPADEAPSHELATVDPAPTALEDADTQRTDLPEQEPAAPVEPTAADDEWAVPATGKKKKGKKNKKGKADSSTETQEPEAPQEVSAIEDLDKSQEAPGVAVGEAASREISAEDPEPRIANDHQEPGEDIAAPAVETTAAEDEWAEPSGGKKKKGKKKKGKGKIDVLPEAEPTDAPQDPQPGEESHHPEVSADPISEEPTVSTERSADLVESFEQQTPDEKFDDSTPVKEDVAQDEPPAEPSQETAFEQEPEPSKEEPEIEFTAAKPKGKKGKGKKGKRKADEEAAPEKTESTVETLEKQPSGTEPITASGEVEVQPIDEFPTQQAPEEPPATKEVTGMDIETAPVEVTPAEETPGEPSDPNLATQADVAAEESSFERGISEPAFHDAATEVAQEVEVTRSEDFDSEFKEGSTQKATAVPETGPSTVGKTSPDLETSQPTNFEVVTGQAADEDRRDSAEFHSYPTSPVEATETLRESGRESEEPELYHDSISENLKEQQTETSAGVPELEIPMQRDPQEAVGETRAPMAGLDADAPAEPSLTPDQKPASAEEKIDGGDSTTVEKSDPTNDTPPHVSDSLEPAVGAESKDAPDTWAPTTSSKKKKKGKKKGGKASFGDEETSQQFPGPEPSMDEPKEAPVSGASSYQDTSLAPVETSAQPEATDIATDSAEQISGEAEPVEQERSLQQETVDEEQSDPAPSAAPIDEKSQPTLAPTEPVSTDAIDQSDISGEPQQAATVESGMDQGPPVEGEGEFQPPKSKKQKKKDKKKRAPIDWEDDVASAPQTVDSTPEAAEEPATSEVVSAEPSIEDNHATSAVAADADSFPQVEPSAPSELSPEPEPEEFQSAKSKKKAKKAKKKQASMPWDDEEAAQPLQTEESTPAISEEPAETPKDDGNDDAQIVTPTPGDDPSASITDPAPELEEFQSSKAKRKAKKDKKKQSVSWDLDETSPPEEQAETIPEAKDIAEEQPKDIKDDQSAVDAESLPTQTTEAIAESDEFQSAKSKKKGKKDKKKKQKQSDSDWTEDVPSAPEITEPSDDIPEVTDSTERGDVALNDVDSSAAEPEAGAVKTQAIEPETAHSEAPVADIPAESAEADDFETPKSSKKAKKDKKKKQKQAQLDWTEDVPSVPEITDSSQLAPELPESTGERAIPIDKPAPIEPEISEPATESEEPHPVSQAVADDLEPPSQTINDPVPEAEVEEFESAKSSKKAKKDKKKKQKQAELEWTEDVPAMSDTQEPSTDAISSQVEAGTSEKAVDESVTEPNVTESAAPSAPSEPALEAETEEFQSAKSNKKAKKDKKKKQKQAALDWTDETPVSEARELENEPRQEEAAQPESADPEEFQSAKTSKKAKKDKKKKQKQDGPDWTDDVPPVAETRVQSFEDTADSGLKEVDEPVDEPDIPEPMASVGESELPDEDPEEFQSAKSKKKAKKDKKKGKKQLDWTDDAPLESTDKTQDDAGLEELDPSLGEAKSKEPGITEQETIPEFEVNLQGDPSLTEDVPETTKEILEEDGDGKEFQLSESHKDFEEQNDQEKASDWTNVGPSSQVEQDKSQESPQLADPDEPPSPPFPSISDEPSFQLATIPEESSVENVRDFETFSVVEGPSEATDEDRKALSSSGERKDHEVSDQTVVPEEAPTAPIDDALVEDEPDNLQRNDPMVEVNNSISQPQPGHHDPVESTDSITPEPLSRKLSKKEKRKGKKKGKNVDNEESPDKASEMDPISTEPGAVVPSEEVQEEATMDSYTVDSLSQDLQAQDAPDAGIDDSEPAKPSKKKKDKKGKKGASDVTEPDSFALEPEQQQPDTIGSTDAPADVEGVSKEKNVDDIPAAEDENLDTLNSALEDLGPAISSSKKKKDKKKKKVLPVFDEEPTKDAPEQAVANDPPVPEHSSAVMNPESMASASNAEEPHKDDGNWPSIDWARESSEIDKAVFSGSETGVTKEQDSLTLDEPHAIQKVLMSAEPHTIDEYDEKTTPLKQRSLDHPEDSQQDEDWPTTPTKKGKKDRKGKIKEDQSITAEAAELVEPTESAPAQPGVKGIGEAEVPAEDSWDFPVKKGKKGKKDKKKQQDDLWEGMSTEDQVDVPVEESRVVDPEEPTEAVDLSAAAGDIGEEVPLETEPAESKPKEVQADDFWDVPMKKGKKSKKDKKKGWQQEDVTGVEIVDVPGKEQDVGTAQPVERGIMSSSTGNDELQPEGEAADSATKEVQQDDSWDVPVKKGKKGKKGKKQRQAALDDEEQLLGERGTIEESVSEPMQTTEQVVDDKHSQTEDREMPSIPEYSEARSKEIVPEGENVFDLGTERSIQAGPVSPGISDTEPDLPTPGDNDIERAPSPIDSTTKDRSSVLFHSSPSTRTDLADSNSKEVKSRTADRSERRHTSTPREIQSFHEFDQETPSKPPRRLTEISPSDAPQSLFGGPVGPGSDRGMSISPPKTPLDTIREHVPESSPSHGRERELSDVGMPEQGTKVARHDKSPRQVKGVDDELPSSRTPESNLIQRLSSPGAGEHERSMDMDRSISSRNSNRSIESGRRSSGGLHVDRLRTPDNNYPDNTLRPSSVGSNRSSGTRSLRRVDRSLSGDLRAASKRGMPRTATTTTTNKTTEAEVGAEQPPPATDEEEVIPSSSTYDPITDKGKRPARDMAGVYEGWGDVQEAPRSPSRPPSVRRRRSMQQVQELETRVDQLVSENRLLTSAKATAEDAVDELNTAKRQNAKLIQERDSSIKDKEIQIQQLKHSLDWLKNEVARLTQVNEGLSATNENLHATHEQEIGQLHSEHTQARQEWEQSSRELEELRQQHGQLSTGMEDIVRHEIEVAMAAKNAEVRQLQTELKAAQEKVKELQQQIVAANKDDVLVFRDEDYFEGACQKLCQHVQQWVLRFSKFSDTRLCRLTSEIRDEKIVDRFENAILDGSDVDAYLGDRVKRRDVFMSVVMTMVWEFIFTRYLFGMDREQRQKLKSLEKHLAEVGPQPAVHRWRATTLSLLSKRSTFHSQRESDTEAVVLEIFNTLSKLLPPPHHMENQIRESLRNVMRAAVRLSIEMRTQRAEYIMLPPLQPEYDTNGDLARKVYFNAALMNERSGETTSNEALEESQAVVRMVLFPLVVKKGNDTGEGDDEIVVCPAQVLVAKPGKDKKVVRVLSGDRMSIDQGSRSVQSVAPSSNMDMGNMI